MISVDFELGGFWGAHHTGTVNIEQFLEVCVCVFQFSKMISFKCFLLPYSYLVHPDQKSMFFFLEAKRSHRAQLTGRLSNRNRLSRFLVSEELDDATWTTN